MVLTGDASTHEGGEIEPGPPPVPAASPVIVLPTYREAANIRAVLEAIRSELPDSSVLVVDDEGGDGTAEAADEVGAETGRVEVLRRRAKEGLGPAYVAGFRAALERGATVVIGMDADLSHDAAVLPALVAAIAGGADVAIGSRYVPGGRTVDWPLHRRLLSRAGNRYATLALGIPVRDATSAYRAFRADALTAVDLDGLAAHGYGFIIELIYRLAQSGASIVEVPITFADRVNGKSKMTPAIAFEALVVVTRLARRDAVRRLRRRLAERRRS